MDECFAMILLKPSGSGFLGLSIRHLHC
jgi:hypothetical protein